MRSVEGVLNFSLSDLRCRTSCVAHCSRVGKFTRYYLGSSDRIILGTWNFTTNPASCSSALFD